MPSRGPRGGEAHGEVRHVPVLVSEAVAALGPRAGGVYIDGTFGAGGHARAILDAADCTVLAVDRDPSALDAGKALVAKYTPRLRLIEGRFGDLYDLVRDAGVEHPDGVLLDIGVSSMQIDDPARGFSFQSDGPLDMRMSGDGETAADAVNRTAEADLADILFQYGEERRSRALARAIVARRAEKPFTRTADLAGVVARVLGRRHDDRQHPATRTFQALRIYVNDELGELGRALHGAERLLAEGGRLAVITFHSLEDRIVKRFLAARSGRAAGGSRHAPASPSASRDPSFTILNVRPVSPGEEEVRANPRARSARMRTAVRTAHAAWPEDA